MSKCREWEKTKKGLTRITNDLIDDPERRTILEVLDSVDFLLLESPIRESGFGMTPHRDAGGLV